MKVLLFGVLFGLLQGGLHEVYYHKPLYFAKFPQVIKGPFGLVQPIVRDYYRPHYSNPSQLRQDQDVRDLYPDYYYAPNENTPFHRGHIEAVPNSIVSVKSANLEDEGRVPLRDAVERIPIEGQMNILVKSNTEDNGDDNPFSRSHIEAFPEPQVPYSFEAASSFNALLYSAPKVQKDYPQIGYRNDVEAPPKSPNVNILSYYRSPNHRVSNFEDQWTQLVSAEFSPTLYKSWNNPVTFRTNDGDKKVVCFYASWAVYRPKPLDFDIKDIDPFACTHVIYAFAGLDNNTLTITSLDRDRDVVQGAYKSLVALKARNPDLRLLIAVGGYEEGGIKFSDMVSTAEKRMQFADSVIAFIQEHSFDGLDLNWEYPGAPDRGGRSSDKMNLALLLEHLYPIFKQKGWTLTMAVPIDKARVDSGYDIPRFANSIDFFNLMAYDLRGPFEGFADHHAPLAAKSSDSFIHKGLNLKDGVQLFVDLGAPKHKLVVGVPFYGRSFTLQDPNENMPGSKIINLGREGRYTRQKGYLAYYEICMEQRNGGWELEVDEVGGPYMSKGNQWVGYDDEDYIESKVDYIKHESLGGVMLWSLDLDDYLGLCGTRWPLLSAIRRALHTPKTTSSTIKPTSMMQHKPHKPTLDGAVRATPPTPSAFLEEGPEEPAVPKGPQPGDSCSGSMMISNPYTCEGYLVCDQGKLLALPCGKGLHWNDRKKFCDWPDQAKCKKTKRPQKIPITASDIATEPSVFPAPSLPQPSVSLEPAPTAGPLSGDYMVVCYFTNWAWYRPGLGKYSPDDIDESICTHIVYGFAVLDYSNLIIKPHDSWADMDNRFYERVTALRAKGIKVTLAIGGWNDSEGDKYSRLVNNPSARAKFIDHVVGFIQKHNFDGLDLDWEYPVCWQVDCKKGPASDKENFGAFVRELSIAFKPHGLLLSAAVSPSKKVIDMGYDVPTLNQYLDWIAVMTYDFHGHWDKKTGHVAPVYYHPEDDYDYFNMDYAIRYWIEKGTDKKKIVLGMPLYGQAFTLNDPSVNGLNAPANLKGQAGEYTRAAGFLAYYEVCKNIAYNGWTVVRDPEGRMGPYAYKDNQWVSFDDIATIKKKSQYIRENGLGGGMVWALDLDDFTNQCGQGKHPLMKTIQSILGPADSGSSGMKPETQPMMPQPQMPQPQVPQPQMPQPQMPQPQMPQPQMPQPQMPQPQMPDMSRPPKPDALPSSPHIRPQKPLSKVPMEMGGPQGGYKVVCYYTNWSWYRQGEGKYVPEDIDSSLCTHINYGFVVLDRDKLVMKPHDSWADIDNNFYTRVIEFKKRGAKVLIALGGWNDSQGDKYSRLVNNPQARKRFNEHALSFIQQYGFDGLDLDWEYPKCWQVDCNKGPASDKQGFTDWIMELNALFKPYGYLLTAAVSPSYKVIEHAYDVPALSTYLDFINVMTYDYHGQWDKITGHVSPMYAHPEDAEMKFNTDFTINHWIQLGANPKKLILGMPMYGQSFTLSMPNDNGLNQKSYGGGEAGPYTRARGFLAYYEICYFIKHQSWTVVRDPLGTMGPYAYRGNQWVGFDDIPQIRYKSEYVKQKGLGGAMIWALDLDDFKNRCGCEHHPLLKTINRVLRNFQPASQECPLLGGGSSQAETPPRMTTTTTTTMATTTRKPQPFTRPVSPMTQEIMTHHPVTQRPMTQRPMTPPQPQPGPPPPPEATSQMGGGFGMEGDKCMAGEFKRHPDCGKFYECYEGMLREISCYPGFHHNGMGRCKRPVEANCMGTRIGPRPPTVAIEPVIPQIITRPEIPVFPGTLHQGIVKTESDYGNDGAHCQVGDFKRHLRCDRFYQCLHGKLTERRCLPGLDWDGQGKCAWPEKAGCKKSAPLPSPPIIDVPQPQRPFTQEPLTMPTTTTTTTTMSTTDPTSIAVRSSTQWYVPWTPSTEATTPRPTHAPGSLELDGYKVVCYFTNWAWYRQRVAKYKPEDIDPNLCTHIIYGFAVLDSSTLLIKPHDTWADYDNKFYQKVTGLKAKGIRVLLAIGGWNDSKGSKYSRLVNDPAARARFTDHVVEFIEKHNFDGLDLDWEYPKCWQVDCSKGPDSDKDGFSAWIKELRAAFRPRNWLLTAAVSPSYKVIDAGYHVRDLTDYLDFVNVMTYDYHGHWDKQTGHVAPMLHHPESIAPEFNANYTINYFIQHGANPRKLIMGMPMYGQAFTLMSPSNTSYNSPARKGQAGEYTRAAGFLAYYEICYYIANSGYTVVKDPSGSIGPYAYKGNQWVGFDDVAMIRFKSEYIKNMGLGGGMIWALDLDDFNNRCNCESHPLLKTINRVLRNYPPASVDCSLG